MNRPFAVLKDMLPPREKPEDANAKKRTGPKPDRHPRQAEPAREKPAAKPANRPVPKTAAPDGPGNAGVSAKPALAAATPEEQAALLEQQEKRLAAAERYRRNSAKAAEGITALTAAYPAVFDRASPRPLAIGIHKELLAASREGRLPAPTGTIRLAIDRWTGAREYLVGLVEGAARVDLQGEPAGEVTAEQALTAQQTLQKREQRRQARQKAAPARAPRGARPPRAKPDDAQA